MHHTPTRSTACTHRTRGVGLVEAIVVTSIASTAFAALMGAVVIYLQGGLYAAEKVRALSLVEEGVEAVRFLRDESYNTNITPLIDVGIRYLDPASGGWTVSSTNTAIFGIFTRTISVYSVYRRTADDDIVPASSGDPKYIDAGTAQVTVAVTWPKGTTQTTTYVANVYEN